MRKVLFLWIGILCHVGAIAQTDVSDVPLLDRKLFFGNPSIANAQLSPDGKMLAFMKEFDGIMNIWVKMVGEPFDDARPLTNSKRPLYNYFWSYDGKYLLYVKDENGDENVNVFAVDPLEKSAGNLPRSRNLTPLKDVTAEIKLVSRLNPDKLVVALNDRDKAWHDLYEVQISTGKLTKLYENKERITNYDFDWDEKLRILSKTDERGTTVMFEKIGDKLNPIYEINVSEQASIASWTADNKKIYMLTNKGDRNLLTLTLFDPATKEAIELEKDPNDRVDVDNVIISDLSKSVIATSYTDDKTVYSWKDKTWEGHYNWIKSKFPGREIGIQSVTRDERKFLVSVYGDKYATEVHYFDADKKEISLQYVSRPELKEVEQYLAPMTPIRYKSRDGMEISGYLTLPVGKTGKDLPVVVLVHGGPKGPRDFWGYNSNAQFLANRGYAVLQPNYRASGGYGKKFLNAGDMQWGKLMQDDITWGVKHLISEGIANKDKVAIMGGSYGGYATLAGLAFTPDVFACGVDIVGPSNLFTLLQTIPPYWESGKAFLYGMVGDPNTEEGKKRIEEASPLFSADKIKRPLLIIQGANDARVKQDEADQIVAALRNKGKQVSYLLADDEGHGFYKPVNRMAMYAETEKFLAAVLGGKYQKDMPDDVAKRLKEMTVDISKVSPKNAVTPKVPKKKKQVRS